MNRAGANVAAAVACVLSMGLTIPAATRAQARQDTAMKEAKPGLLAQGED